MKNSPVRPLCHPSYKLVLLAAGVLLLACALLAAGNNPPPPQPNVLRAHIRSILARPEYNPPDTTALQAIAELLGRVIRRILDVLLRPLQWLISRLATATGEGPPVSRWLVIGLLTALIFLILAHLYYTAASAFGRRRPPRAPARPVLREPASLYSSALQAAQAGDYHAALRLLYASVMACLDRAGLVDFHPARTNWAYLSDVSEREDIYPPLHDLTSIVDRAVYAAAPVSEQTFRRALELAAQIEGRVG